MKFRVICQKTSSGAHSPIQVVDQSTGKGVAWINRYLDREYVRRLADKSLYSYAHSLLHFVRWWESVHHTGEISAADLTESTLLDYVRFQSSRRPPPFASTINIAPPLPIVLSTISSPMLPVRSPTAFISPSCIAGRWAWDAPGSNSADSEYGSPSSTTFLSRSMKCRASGPVFETLATWPSSA